MLFFLIFGLTVLDVLCTIFGIRSGVIAEANPLLAAPMNFAPELTGAMVCALTAAVLYFIWKARLRIAWVQGGLRVVLAAKLLVMALHLNWMIGTI